MAKKQLAQEYYKAPPYDVILEPAKLAGRWHESFGRVAPLHVEVGIGLGHHLVQHALIHPDQNHLGLDLKMHRIYTARHKALRQGARFVRFVPGDADEALAAAFADGEVDRMTLLFPDPWPDNRDAPKRLTHPDRVARYRRLLHAGGVFHFRTDDEPLYMYSRDVFLAHGFALVEAVELERTTTDFEARWLLAGRAIFGFDAVRLG
ncbi:MAG: tRNA ((7)-)-methyltransferase [Cyanobacteria bacterium RYN_339]|nr:tRNA ((7)-)-methyltransferase [Cyanobacteria bacterium RYN_339]